MAKKKKDDKVVDHGLDQALINIQKLYGKGTVISMGDKPQNVEVISSGSLALDKALKSHGYPRGSIVEMFGESMSGKTTIALHLIAEAQRLIKEGKLEGKCAFVDAEQSLNLSLAKGTGVDTDELLISQPDYGEQALEVVEELVRSGGCPVIVVDSVAALVPKAELLGNMGDSLPGLHARLMSQALRKLVGYISKSNTIVVFINQTRQKIGVMYGSNKTTTGGKALKFYASVRVEVITTGAVKKSEERIGNELKIVVVKNKIAAPFGECKVELIYGTGIDLVLEVLDLAQEFSFVEKSGNTYGYGNIKLGVGQNNAANFLRKNTKVLDELRSKVVAKMELNK